jgi:HPt (histidine-containing phosphotransfer) domain-containing protein
MSSGEPIKSDMLEGIDLQTGLAHLAGNWKLYSDLLLKFSSSNATFAQRLAELLNNGKLSDVGRMIHTLKGLAGSLGMTRLCLLSHQLEEIIRHGVTGDPRYLVQPLSDELAKVIGSIQRSIPQSEVTHASEPLGMTIARLQELESALNDHNPDATKQVRELGSITGYESEMIRLKKAVAEYEFDTALAVLREIKSHQK